MGQIFRALPELTFGLQKHPVVLAEPGEIIHIERAELGLQGREDIGELDTQGLGLVPLNLQQILRNVRAIGAVYPG